jgi:hypothetical protein
MQGCLAGCAIRMSSLSKHKLLRRKRDAHAPEPGKGWRRRPRRSRPVPSIWAQNQSLLSSTCRLRSEYVSDRALRSCAHAGELRARKTLTCFPRRIRPTDAALRQSTRRLARASRLAPWIPKGRQSVECGPTGADSERHREYHRTWASRITVIFGFPPRRLDVPVDSPCGNICPAGT